MRVLVLGGDGYLGWPTAMHLAAAGHEVVTIDNFLRRRLCQEIDVRPLYEVAPLQERARRWHERSGQTIDVRIGDLCDWSFTERLFQEVAPDAVVHYAEQPSGPYSMIDQRAARLTVHNNLISTLHVAHAVHAHCPDCHIVKLGTMGEYGTPDIDIEEGWLTVDHKGRSDRFLFPRQAGSLYHTTKIMDTDMLWFYVRVWGLRVTDLMQGPVYGVATTESGDDEAMWSIFNYDAVFGTVINRFVVQAVCGFPLTVYGRGGQTRGYINVEDTINCIRLAVEHPAQPGEHRIFNQITETLSVLEIAEKVRDVGSAMSLAVEVQTVDNLRVEAEEHYYNPVHRQLVELGLEPHLLTDEVMASMLEIVARYRERVDERVMLPTVSWR